MALGRLTIDLEANIARFERGLNRAEQLMQRRTRQIQRIARRAGVLIGAGLGAALGGGLSRSIRSATSDLSDLANQAEKLGLSTDALQEFRFAAGQVGVAARSLDVGFQRFTRRSAEAAAGSKELAGVFDQLGIQLRDNQGNLRSNEVLFSEFVESLADVENQSERVRLAFKLLDTEGVDLVRLAGRFDELRQKGRDLGVVIDSQVVKNAREAGDRLEALSTVIQANLSPVLANLAPILIRITEGFAKATSAVKDFFNIDFGQSPTIQSLEKQLTEFKSKREELSDEISRIETNPGRRRRRAGRFAALTEELQNLETRIDLTQSKIRRLTEESNQAAEPQAAIGGPPIPTGATREQQKFDTLQDITAEYDKQIAQVQSVINGTEREFEITQAIADARARGGPNIAGQEGVIQARVEQLQTLQAQLEANQEAERAVADEAARLESVYQSVRNPADELSQTFVDLNTLLEQGRISWDTYSTAVFQAQASFEGLGDKVEEETDDMSQFAIQAARNMQDAFAQYLFDPFENDGLEGMLNGFVDTLRKMAAQAAAAKIFESIGTFGQSQGGLVGTALGFLAPKAFGGPVAANTPYLVGEQGPEMFVPKSAGTIVPNSQVGNSLNVTVNVSGDDVNGFGRTATQAGNDLGRAINLATRRNS